MATFDTLAGDQRAVLELVLARRRGYEEIASMLSLGPDAVRGRALGALDALGPPTDLPSGERQLIGDYLLAQLPHEREAEAQQLLARSPAARAWAVELTPALEPVAVDPLPRIPAAAPSPAEAVPEPAAPPSSRRGGMVVIGVAVAVIIAAVVVLLVTHHHARSGGALADATSTTPATSTSSTTASSSTSAVKYLAQINLRPVASGSKALGIAEILEQDSTREVAIIGQHIPANTKRNSYEVWLYSSPTHFEKLGFVSPAVGKSGTFSDETPLPANAASYHEVIVTTETVEKPTHPGPVLLRGRITGLS